MSVSCIICQEFLTERPQTLSNNQDFIICALTCGHLFHRDCVHKWFQGTGGAGAPTGCGTCPSCKKVSQLSKALRIFPTGDEDSSSVVEENKNLKSLITQNQTLEAKLKDVMNECNELRCKYEEESANHEVVKMQYAEVLSKLDTQDDQLKENKVMNVALENSVKSAMEKVEKEKNEALELLARLQMQNFANRIELIHLKD